MGKITIEDRDLWFYLKEHCQHCKGFFRCMYKKERHFPDNIDCSVENCLKVKEAQKHIAKYLEKLQTK